MVWFLILDVPTVVSAGEETFQAHLDSPLRAVIKAGLGAGLAPLAWLIERSSLSRCRRAYREAIVKAVRFLLWASSKGVPRGHHAI